MNARRIIVGLAAAGPLALVLAVGLTACGLPGGSGVTPIPDSEPIDDPTPVATDDAAPAPAAGERPVASADIECDDLTNPAQLDPLFAVPVTLAPPSRTYEAVGAIIADEFFVRQAGGVACQWSDPEGISTSEGAYMEGIDVRLLPASGPQWQEFSDSRGDGSDVLFECSEYGYCEYNRYTANNWWLQLNAFDIRALALPTESSLRALTSPVFSAIAATVAELPGPDAGWTPPEPDISFGGGCTGVISASRLASALGIGVPLAEEWLQFPQIGTAATLSVGGSACRWARASDGWDVAYIEVLPGGEWAQAASVTALEERGGSVPTPAVPGVPAGATALWEHVDSTSLDIVLGGSWVKISIAGGADIGGMSVQNALIAIGAEIAAGA